MSHWYYISPEDYETATKIGVSARLMRQRVYGGGWKVVDAMTTPPREYQNWGQWRCVCEQHGIKWNTFRKRIRMGWDYFKAATQPVTPPNRKYPEQLAVLREANGVSYNTFLHRINASGWTPEEAATTPLVPKAVQHKYAKDPRIGPNHSWRLKNRLLFMSRQESKYVQYGQRY